MESSTEVEPRGTAATELRAQLAVLSDLRSAESLLGWDRETMMPPRGAEARGDVMATLDQLGHERLAAPEFADLLDAAAAEAADDPDGEDAAIVRVVRRDHDRAVRIPVELTAEMARATAAALPVWVAARETSDFASFRPHLERAVALRRDVAACFPDVEHPYDALLESYEPGATTASVREVFATLRAGLVPLIAQIAERPVPPSLPALPFDGQRTIALEMARAIGYDDEGWRLDDSTHPFSQVIGPGDQRVTARWDESDLGGIFAVLHEVGHGLYEQQVGTDLARTTLDTGVSLGVHESQSRLWENQVGRSRAFWSHWLPRAQQELPALAGLDLDAFLRSVNVVQPTLIRVEADEATYALHVILRFQLEVALLEGTLEVDDLPGRVERRDARPARRDRPGRCPRLPAGHPLGVRRARLLPDLRDRQHHERPAVGGAARAGRRHRRGARGRRLRAGARLAARQRALPRARVRSPGAAAPGDRAGARSRAAAGLPHHEVRRALRPGVVNARALSVS